jgi:integrase
MAWHHSVSCGAYGAILRLLLTTGARPGEIGGLRSEELQGDALVLPPQRTKSRRGHIVPLTALAMAQLPRGRRGQLFGAERPFNGWSKGKRMMTERLGAEPAWTPHDLRRTVATRLGELGVSDDVIGRILGHAPQGVTRLHYNHAQRLGEQRAALELWSAEVGRIVGA